MMPRSHVFLSTHHPGCVVVWFRSCAPCSTVFVHPSQQMPSSSLIKPARLGSSLELAVPLGIGTMFWGDSFIDSRFGPILPEEDLRGVVNQALKARVTLFDTAEGYGGGSSETRLAEALSGASPSPSSPVIMTKFLPTIWRWTEWSFFSALRACQRRLGGRPIGVFFIHTPVHPRFEFWVRCACKARQQGLIQEIGLSNCSAEQVELAVRVAGSLDQRIAANQVLFSLLSYNSESLQRMERVCQQHGITIIAYSVLGQGLLTDNLTREKFGRIRAAKMTGVTFEALTALRAQIAQLASKHQVTMAQVCLNWAMQKGAVPLVGIKNETQLNDALGCLRLALTDEEVSLLDAVALSKATLDKSAVRRGVFVVLLSVLIMAYRVTSWLPRWLYMKNQQPRVAPSPHPSAAASTKKKES